MTTINRTEKNKMAELEQSCGIWKGMCSGQAILSFAGEHSIVKIERMLDVCSGRNGTLELRSRERHVGRPRKQGKQNPPAHKRERTLLIGSHSGIGIKTREKPNSARNQSFEVVWAIGGAIQHRPSAYKAEALTT